MKFEPEKKDVVVYLIGSLRNKEVPIIANKLRKDLPKFEFYNSWFYASADADKCLHKNCIDRGFNFKQTINDWGSYYVFKMDDEQLRRADIVVALAPIGRSGFLELGVSLGRGKPGYLYYSEPPQRYDVMLRFCTNMFFKFEDLVTELKKYDKKQ